MEKSEIGLGPDGEAGWPVPNTSIPAQDHQLGEIMPIKTGGSCPQGPGVGWSPED